MTPVPPIGEGELVRRATAVIPGGMYGHNVRKFLWDDAPQFWARGSGYLIWDADGREYVDLMCSWGPIIHGHQHPFVEAAAERQRRLFDTGNGPSELFVLLAERLIGLIDHAQWAVFAKNGGDVTTLALTVARAATSRSTVLVARGAYHGSLPWCSSRTAGVTAGDRAHIAYFDYNDPDDLRAVAARHANDLAAIILTPHKHEAGTDSEEVTPHFAASARSICDASGAALILDEVRTGFRLHLGSSWAALGIQPDLSCWSKGVANGYPLSTLTGSEWLRDAAARVSIGGTFWMSAVPMAAALATIDLLEQEGGVTRMAEAGTQITDALRATALEHDVAVRISGPPAMPYLSFSDDPGWSIAKRWAAEMARRGVYVNPSHNWFMSTALNAAAIARVSEAAGGAFRAVASYRG